MYGSRDWLTFQDMMDHIKKEIEQYPGINKESTIIWMQILSGQSVDVFNFAEWATVSSEQQNSAEPSNNIESIYFQNGLEVGFGYQSETEFWTVMNTYYRDFFNEWGFFDWYKDGRYTYNAGGVLATGACLKL